MIQMLSLTNSNYKGVLQTCITVCNINVIQYYNCNTLKKIMTKTKEIERCSIVQIEKMQHL